MMKKKLCLLFCVLFILDACSSKNEKIIPWENDLSVEQNIAKNAIILENNNDFHFLDKIVDGRSIIILGEETHYDYSTSEIKIKMINYLIGKGFNSIIFEGSPILSSYIFSNPQYAELTKEWDVRALMPGSLNYKINQSFITTLQERKMKIFGGDIFMSPYDIDAVKTILNKYKNDEILIMDWAKLREYYLRKFVLTHDYHSNKLSVDEQYKLMRMIDTLSIYTQYIMFSKETTMELKVLMQWIRNLNTAFSIVDPVEVLINPRGSRDMQMAENIDWIVKNFPKEKFIVWTANFHGAKDISQTIYPVEPVDSLLYFNYQTMGETLADKYKDKMYSLAFTSLRDEFTSLRDDKTVGKLEKEIANTTGNAPYAFIDFEPLRFADGYRYKEFESRGQGKWQYIFDGIFYIRDYEFAFPDSIK